MSYAVLPLHLHATADAVVSLARDEYGLKGFKIETGPDNKLNFRPTIHCFDEDKRLVCFEVVESAYPDWLDRVVLQGIQLALPMKLYVVIPSAKDDSNFAQNLKRAKSNGVGVLEISSQGVVTYHHPLPLSFLGVRPIDVQTFPRKYRNQLVLIQNTYSNGSPAEACGMVYNEIEAVIRSIGELAVKKGWWNGNAPSVDFENGAWYIATSTLERRFDKAAARCPLLDPNMFSQVKAVIPNRNQTNHKVRDFKARQKRDKQLRTRFETAVDLLHSLIHAAKPLRI